jgi:Ca2+-transporting ATPase
MVGAVNDYQKERQFAKLNAKKEERDVKALRDGKERLLSIYSILVGDVLFLEPGDVIPADGIFLQGHNVRCDESGATGESDAVRKVPYDELVNKRGGGKSDCFLISGSQVIEGVGTYVVTAVGQHSFNGKIMMCTSEPLGLRSNSILTFLHLGLRLRGQHCERMERILRFNSNSTLSQN